MICGFVPGHTAVLFFVYSFSHMSILIRVKSMLRNERGLSMAVKKNKPIKLEELTQEEKLKYEIAEELGLLDKVMEEGWKSLSSKETGRIGGLMTKKKKEMEK